MTKLERKLFESLLFIYKQEQADSLYHRLIEQIDHFREQNHPWDREKLSNRVSESDSILITYGDMVQSEGQNPLQTLASFLQKTVGDIVSSVHILPFYPYSSDDGFAVIDYHQVNPDYGGWADVADLGENFRLMFDAVVNHISAESAWFQGFLEGEPKFQGYFYEVDADFDISNVFRPRALPLRTTFETIVGPKKVWTTFSADQIDLNFENPDLLLAVIEVLLTYVAQGAEFIRLDAIAFIWKESGTRCLHQPQTHRIIQLMRTVLDMVAPGVSIITETNVPHEENISYFGDGFNEAQMVYNFSLPPLTLHAFHTGNAEVLSAWAKTLSLESDQTTFFNFLASHDGVGLMPVRGILPETEIEKMAKRVEALGGFVSYKNNPDGSQMAYEMNINFLEALGDPENPESNLDLVAKRFLASQSIMLALRGVPGIYFHSLFGSQNWKEGVEKTGRNRTINREKLQLERLERELADPTSLRYPVFNGFCRMLEVRKTTPAFHPCGGQEILDFGKSIFAILRASLNGETYTLCLHNVTNQVHSVEIDLTSLPVAEIHSFVDILTNQSYAVKNSNLNLNIAPYQALWLQIK